MPLRPSHWASILNSVWAPNSASTQPVSRLVLSVLPQVSVDLVNVVLFDAFWHGMLLMLGVFIENELPEPEVSMCTGFGPFHALVPLPCITCSWVWSTAPVL